MRLDENHFVSWQGKSEDSGCTRRMTEERSLLTNYKKERGTIIFCGNTRGNIEWIGNLEKKYVTIQDVFYVNGLNHNLLSISQFCDKGCTVQFVVDTCKIISPDEKLAFKAERDGNLFSRKLSSIKPIKEICIPSKVAETTWLWHQTLAHVNFRNINELAKKDMVRGLPKLRFVTVTRIQHTRMPSLSDRVRLEKVNKTYLVKFEM